MEIPVALLFGVAILVVLLTSLFKHVEWGHKVKALLATVVSVAAAAVATWSTGEFTGENLMQASLGVYGLSQAFYHLLFHGTTVDDSLASVGSSDELV